MIRPLTALTMLMAGGSGLYLYQAKHRAQMLDREITTTMHAAEQARERAGVLRGEWALLNDPERLTAFADRFLPLKTVQPGQFTSLAELDRHLPAVRHVDAPKATTDEPLDEPATGSIAAPEPAKPEPAKLEPPKPIAAAPAPPRQVASLTPHPVPAPRAVARLPMPETQSALAMARTPAERSVAAAAPVAAPMPVTAPVPAVRHAAVAAPAAMPAAAPMRMPAYGGGYAAAYPRAAAPNGQAYGAQASGAQASGAQAPGATVSALGMAHGYSPADSGYNMPNGN
jgi:hypothetical protein